MPIEQLYPYIAVAYGTFGIVFGVALWWKTQRRIDRTKMAIETQVAAAVVDITNKVDSKLGGFKMPEFDLKPLTAQLDELQESIPEFDEDALFARIDKLETDLPNIVGTHVSMAVKGVQAEQARAVSDYLEQTVPEWEKMSKDAQAELMTQVNPVEIIGNAILNYKPPPVIRKKYPWAIPLIEGQKMQAFQFIQGMAALKSQGNVVIEGGGYSGEGHRPGLRR